MSDIITSPERDEKTIAGEINAIKKQTTQICLRATIEVGRLLCEAKELVPYGSWGDWLRENVGYSQSNANNLMRIFREYGTGAQLDIFSEDRLSIFEGITPTQALALTALPEPERREFVKTHDMDVTSVRDIQAEIKARREAEEKAKAAEERAEIAEKLISGAQAEQKRACEALEKYRADEARRIEDIKAAAEQSAADAVKDRFNAEKIKLTNELKGKYEKQLSAANQKHDTELKKAKEANDKIAAERDGMRDKLTSELRSGLEKEYAERIAALEKEASAAEKRAAAAANTDVQMFAVLFEQWQGTYNQMSAIIGKMREDGSTEGADKLAGVLERKLKQWAGVS